MDAHVRSQPAVETGGGGGTAVVVGLSLLMAVILAVIVSPAAQSAPPRDGQQRRYRRVKRMVLAATTTTETPPCPLPPAPVEPPPPRTVFVLRPCRLRPPIPMAVPLPVGRVLRLRRVPVAVPTEDLRLAVWAYDRQGRGLTAHPDRLHIWRVSDAPLIIPLGPSAVHGVGRVTVNLMGTLRDTDVEVALLAAPDAVVGADAVPVWRDTIRRGTQWLHEVTFGVPEEWQPGAQWDASRVPSMVLGSDDATLDVWVPLRPAWAGLPTLGGGFAAQPSRAPPVTVVEEPPGQRAVRLPPGAWLLLDAPSAPLVGTSNTLPNPPPASGTILLVVRTEGSGARTIAALLRGTSVLDAAPLLAVRVERDGAVVLQDAATQPPPPPLVRHAATPLAGLIILACVYQFNSATGGVTLTTMCTGDTGVRSSTWSRPTAPAGPPSMLLWCVGADRIPSSPSTIPPPADVAGTVARTLDVHEMVFFPRAMDAVLLAAVHQELRAKWTAA